jgi:hypothetical protein
VSDNLGRSIDMAIQQEQPLAPPAFAAAAVNADSTITSKHKGTVYPDVFVLRYLLQVRDNFRNLTHRNMGHNEIDYLVFAELKRSIKRAFIRKGLKVGNNGYTELLDLFRRAALQVARQAYVAMKRPGETNSDVILIAVVGPFWMWCSASRAQILDTFPSPEMEDILEAIRVARERDSLEEEDEVDEVDNESHERPTHISSALLRPIAKKDVFVRGETGSKLGWSNVLMLDTRESEMALRTLTQALLEIVKKK